MERATDHRHPIRLHPRPIKLGPLFYPPKKFRVPVKIFLPVTACYCLLLPVTACSCPPARLPSKDPAIVRRRSPLSLPRLHLDHLLRGWPDRMFAGPLLKACPRT